MLQCERADGDLLISRGGLPVLRRSLPCVCLLSILAIASRGQAGTITGDTFAAKVTENGSTVVATGTSVAGAPGGVDLCSLPGASCSAGTSFDVDWPAGIIDDQLEFDWVNGTTPDITRLTLELTDLDFVDFAMQPERILGLSRPPSNFPPEDRLDVSFTADSITLDYVGLATGEPGDGDVQLFDIGTAAPPTDSYSIDVSEEAIPFATVPGVRGDTSTLTIVDDYRITWVDEDSFTIDWFASTVDDVVIVLNGIDLANYGGQPGAITGVVKGPSTLIDPTVSFTANSVTLTYAGMAAGESEDGDFRTFDLQTNAPPTDFYTLMLSENAVLESTATSVRGVEAFDFFDSYRITWLDADTFQVDWFASNVTDGNWVLRDLTFYDANGQLMEITNVVKGSSTFCVDPTVSFTATTITLDYSGMAIGDSECGDVREFDVVPEAGGLVSLVAGSVLLVGLRKRRRTQIR
jgi:hypothetical protein